MKAVGSRKSSGRNIPDCEDQKDQMQLDMEIFSYINHLLHHTEIFYFHYRLFFEFPLFMQVFTDQLLPLLKNLQLIFLLIIETAYCKLQYTIES